MNGRLENLAWNLFTDLRKELVSLQTIRSQLIGFKITFVSTSIAIIAAKLDEISPILFVIPGFAAIFFDFLIHSYSYSIKRTGFYCRVHLEPILRKECLFPKNHYLWEEFMASPDAGKNVPFWGTLGITVLAIVPAVVALLRPFILSLSFPLLVTLFVLMAYNIRTLYKPSAFTRYFVDYRSPRPAVAVIIEKDNMVLLAQRAIEPAKGKWDIIGGFIESEESAERAAEREVEEETGLQICITEYLGSVQDVYGETGITTINFCFVAKVKSGEPTPKSDVASLKWFMADELPKEMAFSHQHEVLQRYKGKIPAFKQGC